MEHTLLIQRPGLQNEAQFTIFCHHDNSKSNIEVNCYNIVTSIRCGILAVPSLCNNCNNNENNSNNSYHYSYHYLYYHYYYHYHYHYHYQVWLTGGAFIMGGGPWFGPDYWMIHNIILVGIE